MTVTEPGITVRRAAAADAQAIGAVFDAAVRDGWTFLGDVSQRQMFSAEHAGRGIGGTLLNAAHEALWAVGRTEAFLFSEEHHARAGGLHCRRLPRRRHGPRIGFQQWHCATCAS